MKLLSISGILSLFAYCQLVLHGFVLDKVYGDDYECTPTTTPYALRYQWGETDIIYSAILYISAHCDCKNKISLFKNNDGRKGRKLDFSYRFEVVHGVTEYERDGWKVSPGAMYSPNGVLTWILRAEKGENTNNHVEHKITVHFDFFCYDGAECVAGWWYYGNLSIYENSVLVQDQPFKSTLATGMVTEISGSPPRAGSCGDPHFTTWDGKRFDFHGECDLVLATSPSFGNGKGLDVHIRTAMVVPTRANMHPYSYISEAAVRVGGQVLSIDRNGYWLDGIPRTFDENENKDSISLSGYPVEISNSATKKGKFMKKFTFNLSDYGHLITIKAAKSHIDVALESGNNSGRNHFDDLVGLLGRHSDRAIVDRNGHSMTDAHENDFGQMWQVREWEDMIFPNVTGPQHPTKCNLPPVTQTSRHLRSMANSETLNEAQLVCGHVSDTADRDNCIFDVLATGDIDMAEFYE